MHTIVVSDMHLSDAEPIRPKRPLWKAYKQRRFFFDRDFGRLLAHVQESARGPIELVLNGDIFDFDDISKVPDDNRVDWLSRLRGLGSAEWMSLFKIESIIADHADWFLALREFIAAGHRAIFIVGNHDVELQWPAVQGAILEAIGVDRSVASTPSGSVVFCQWFYMSGEDTYISHGNQYDPYCVNINPIDPLILVRGEPCVRIPFGDLAGRYMLNGMGYFNPHAMSNYIMSAAAYLRFFMKHVARTQPFLLWTWFWSAMATLIVSLLHYWRPAMSDPLLVEDKVQAVADRSQAPPAMVRKLNAMHVSSACANPLSIMRELWLDRALIVLGIIYFALQLVLAVNVVWPISPLWMVVPVVLLSPALLLYHRAIKSSVFSKPLLTSERADLIVRITGMKRVVFGHVHIPEHSRVGEVEYLNSGFWSPAFAEPECKTRVGTQTFVWLSPGEDGARQAKLLEWPPGGDKPRPFLRKA